MACSSPVGGSCATSPAFADQEIYQVSKPRNWETVINRLNQSANGKMRIKMGSPGSAQVTRCRLLAEYRNLRATTSGANLLLELK